MHTLLVIVGIHCVLFGFAFLIAGWSQLASPDKRDIEDRTLEWQVAKEQGWRGIIGLTMETFARGRWPRDDLLRRNWNNQPSAKKFLFAGGLFLLLAAITGYFLGVFN